MTTPAPSEELVIPARRLNGEGQCCGRKPLVYKRDPHLYCTRCSRSYNPETSEQIENWAYIYVGDGKFRFAFRHMKERQG